ncbi:MAG: hypothetical protein ABJN69_00010 [Hellea sp.]
MLASFVTAGKETAKLLAFKTVKIDTQKHGWAFITLAILFAWLAGLGRYWDHPSAADWQYWGLGSVAYIFVLTTILYLVIWPLKPKRWDWVAILIFIGLTSPLAWLYAIPVERFLPAQTAKMLNINFLAIVALWRVILYVLFLMRYAGLRGLRLTAAIFMPLVLIIIGLSMLNLEHAIFEVMAGIEQERSEIEDIHDRNYGTIVLLSVLSFLSLPIWIFIYVLAIIQSRK